MSGVGRRYAHALLSVLGDTPAGDVLKELELLGEWMKKVPELAGVLENPGIPYSVKRSVMEKLSEQAGFRDVSVRFVLLVVQNKRIRQWKDFVDAFRGLCDEKTGVLRGKVMSAGAMKDKEVAKLSESLGKTLGKPVLLDAGVSEELLGGLQLQIGSTVYDGSVAGALKTLRETFVKG